ncbi:TetR/AcrR family transcriptional repressor of nem operon [Bradyrhizobium japonicum]|uniref:TetR/AcrR family transcriptional regulator n=1 Tax=Bradyrhizobium TaxID=374 RepID=UPI00192A9BFF|nr:MULTISPECIES: TetR/AcrR family transcriptional regulator [Bradyrhizobium]MBR0883479.1 TetR/AcrR family transcriptional regulator [Bradyrhizobium liaoningense]MBR0947434.1 TetR/AcrR family transcriptional regulator [Bradyrhizobium liaoningense]MBR1003819.1 TetR/AcrR family transcriptional regulator [Bradyrhizobium liaoningense]MBR1069929.1 TetR/AcrR family transcriptional regulator [Bradyrhizobium liaoningense]MCP1744914.1 AcrR family transcriptional regulator [Bradyrhizobium japonicum]
MPQKTKTRTAGARTGMRDTIKRVATELLIRHGFHNTSFRDIADQIGTTTTNIHYHFGSKQQLVEEVLTDYVAEASARHKSIWLADGHTLSEKLQGVVEYNFERYKRFNRGKAGGRPWSLIGRLRLDSEDLSPIARESLTSFSRSVHEAIKSAFEQACRSGELRADAPLDDLTLLVVNLVNSSSVFTQDAGSFDRLEEFFTAFERVMLKVYAGEPSDSGEHRAKRH